MWCEQWDIHPGKQDHTSSLVVFLMFIRFASSVNRNFWDSYQLQDILHRISPSCWRNGCVHQHAMLHWGTAMLYDCVLACNDSVLCVMIVFCVRWFWFVFNDYVFGYCEILSERHFWSSFSCWSFTFQGSIWHCWQYRVMFHAFLHLSS